MIEYAFTKKNIQRSIAYKDMITDARFREVEHRNQIAKEACEKIECQIIFATDFKVSEIKGKKTFQFDGIWPELATRLISKNLRANYLIKQTNRHNIIKNTVSFLKESSAYSVFRFDIVSFFESVDRSKLFEKILLDGLCSRQTTLLLADFFASLTRQNIPGLPRGLGISSVLAELVLLEFDRAVREKVGVFFYARYVDDILILGSNLITKLDIHKFVDVELPVPLVIHKKGPKVASLTVGKTSRRESTPNSFDYLGYKFCVFAGLHPSETVLGIPRRKVEIEISESKIGKLKDRLIDSFACFITGPRRDCDYTLLKDRVKAITGNYFITDAVSGVQIKTGIYFNYSEKNRFNKCELLKLDNFLRGLIFCRSHRLSVRINAKLTSSQRCELGGFSFLLGFHKRTFYSFDYLQLRHIKEGWKR